MVVAILTQIYGVRIVHDFNLKIAQKCTHTHDLKKSDVGTI